MSMSQDYLESLINFSIKIDLIDKIKLDSLVEIFRTNSNSNLPLQN